MLSELPGASIQKKVSVQKEWPITIAASLDFPLRIAYIDGNEFRLQDTSAMKQKQLNSSSPQPLSRRYDVESVDVIDIRALETIPYEYPGKDIVIDIDTDEFTAVCPYSGLPDFGTIRVHYIPNKQLLELRSLKYYLLSYRNVGIYQEHAVNRILEDLVKCCKPKWMQVIADYMIRGGIHTVASVEWGRRGGKS